MKLTMCKVLLSSSFTALIAVAAAVPGLAQSLQQTTSTQSFLTMNAARFGNGIGSFANAPTSEVDRDKDSTLGLPAMRSWVLPTGINWDQLSDDEKKSFTDQLGGSALRWSTGTEAAPSAKKGSGIFVNRGPQPLPIKVPQN